MVNKVELVNSRRDKRVNLTVYWCERIDLLLNLRLLHPGSIRLVLLEDS